MSSPEHARELTDTRDLDELLVWLEYGKSSGFKAARCSEAQEHYWAKLLRRLLASHAAGLAACRKLDELDWCVGYEMVQHDILQDALDAARAAVRTTEEE